MFDLMMWFIFIPMLVISTKFWVRLIQGAWNNQRALIRRMQRLRSAFAAASREEEE